MVYQLGKIIGKGSDGVVYELLGDDKDERRAIKFIQGEQYGFKNYLDFWISSHLDSKYITKSELVEIEKDGLIKIVQKRADMDLRDYLNRRKITPKGRRLLMLKIIRCVEYLHSYNILHGDIKPSNILIFDDTPKLADFNFSRLIFENGNSIDEKLYTITFRPPEVKENFVTLNSDIWALGCTLFEIYYNYSYFNNNSRDRVFYHIKSNLERKEENKIFNDLIEKMINKDHKSRMNIFDVKNHPYFMGEKYNEQFIKMKEMTKREFTSELEKNFSKFGIKSTNNKKIFLSKFLKVSCIPIHKKYKILESRICESKFDFHFFERF